jgi:hypothetical protein
MARRVYANPPRAAATMITPANPNAILTPTVQFFMSTHRHNAMGAEAEKLNNGGLKY